MSLLLLFKASGPSTLSLATNAIATATAVAPLLKQVAFGAGPLAASSSSSALTRIPVLAASANSTATATASLVATASNIFNMGAVVAASSNATSALSISTALASGAAAQATVSAQFAFPLAVADQTLGAFYTWTTTKNIVSAAQAKTFAVFTQSAAATVIGVKRQGLLNFNSLRNVTTAGAPFTGSQLVSVQNTPAQDVLYVFDIYARTLAGVASGPPDTVTLTPSGGSAHSATKLTETLPGGVGGQSSFSRWAVALTAAECTGISSASMYATWTTVAVAAVSSFYDAIVGIHPKSATASIKQSATVSSAISGTYVTEAVPFSTTITDNANFVHVGAVADSYTGYFSNPPSASSGATAVAGTLEITFQTTTNVNGQMFTANLPSTPAVINRRGYPWTALAGTEFYNISNVVSPCVANATPGDFSNLATASNGNNLALTTAAQTLAPFTIVQSPAVVVIAKSAQSITLGVFGTANDFPSAMADRQFEVFTNAATVAHIFFAVGNSTGTARHEVFVNHTAVFNTLVTPSASARNLNSNGELGSAGGSSANTSEFLLQRFTSSDLSANYPVALAAGSGSDTSAYLSDFGRFKNGSFGIPSGTSATRNYNVRLNPFETFTTYGMYEVSFWFYIDDATQSISVRGLMNVGGIAIAQRMFSISTDPGAPGRLVISGWGTSINSSDPPDTYTVGGVDWIPYPAKEPTGSGFYVTGDQRDRGISVNSLVYGQWNHVVLTQIPGKGVNTQVWLNGVKDLTFILDDFYYKPSTLNIGFPWDADIGSQIEVVEIAVSSAGTGRVAVDELHIVNLDASGALTWGGQPTGGVAHLGGYFDDTLLPHNRNLANIWVPDRPEQATPWGQLVPVFTQVATGTVPFIGTLLLTDASASSITTAALSLSKTLAAAATAQATSTANLTGQLQAGAVASASATAALSHGVPLAAAGVAAASAAITLTVASTISLAAAGAASSNAGAALNLSKALATDAVGQGSAVAYLATPAYLAAAAQAVASAQAPLAKTAGLATTALSTGSATATMLKGHNMAAGAAASGSASASLFIAKALADAAAASASVTAALSIGHIMASVALAESAMTGALSARFIYDVRRMLIVPFEPRGLMVLPTVRTLEPLPP